jgi:uncharacterized protein YegL
MSINELEIDIEDLIENPTPRIPICLALDASWSMNGSKIRELNKGIKYFFESLLDDEVTRYSAEIAVVSFGGEKGTKKAVKLLDFAFIERQEVPQLVAAGWTPMGEGVELSLNLLEQRKSKYKAAGIDYWQPWLIIMTDGNPTDEIKNAVGRVQQLTKNNQLEHVLLHF